MHTHTRTHARIQMKSKVNLAYIYFEIHWNGIIGKRRNGLILSYLKQIICSMRCYFKGSLALQINRQHRMQTRQTHIVCGLHGMFWRNIRPSSGCYPESLHFRYWTAEWKWGVKRQSPTKIIRSDCSVHRKIQWLFKVERLDKRWTVRKIDPI